MLIELPNQLYGRRFGDLLLATAALGPPIGRMAVGAVKLAHSLIALIF
jgi:hypothetical protein